MIKSNQLLLLTLILIVAGLLIGGCYVVLNNQNPVEGHGLKENKSWEAPENNNTVQDNSDENPYVEKTVEVISPESIYEKEKKSLENINLNITQNTKPKFNTGDRFVYEYFIISNQDPIISPDGRVKVTFLDRYSYNVEYLVIDKLRVNKTDYFKIQEYTHDYYVGTLTTKERGSEPRIVKGGNTTIYLNADNGKIFTGIETGKIERLPSDNWMDYWFRTWMLALDDNVKWQKTTEDLFSSDRWDVSDFSVEGREKIGGRECFKVLEEEKACQKNSNCEMTGKRIYYIDAEKRILMKVQKWWENLNIGETKLTYPFTST